MYYEIYVAQVHCACYMVSMQTPRARMFDENEIEQVWRDAYAAGWRACWDAMQQAMQEKTAPYLPRAPKPEPQTTQWYALEAVNAQHGMTTLETITRAKQMGCTAPDGSIRVALVRLKGKRLIVARDDKWFPA